MRTQPVAQLGPFSLVTILATLCGCQQSPEKQASDTQDVPPAAASASRAEPPEGTPVPMRREDPGDANSPAVSHAIAVLSPTQGNEVKGTVTFIQSGDGLKVVANVDGLPAGPHAYHVHLYGDCSSDDAKSAGTHFNFQGSSTHPPKDIQRITGNLGVLNADAKGHAHDEHMVQAASLNGQYSIVGRAVVIHQSGNDPKSPPIGAAGARLACGVIGADSSREAT